ncbi:RNA degradosome polyphosphate kinase [Desulfoprunum benzoelyticum]|uniref:Polyphosphate kinase n=2 Tax=Desulfoprunum benzoelyticum TaxID=1506996 RepID=A0A840UPV5_9BACT|nr:polyphosphate kinase [Desulfoprunum benzoelyticum]MBM9529462.1 RNA degradosome polyphosphate kinase [Desulfoprunum benzoelyticum]
MQITEKRGARRRGGRSEAEPGGMDHDGGAESFLRTSPKRFFNRELSWLAFNERVLEEAKNVHHPLLERVRFLSISASNWDEFYMVRVAGLMGQIAAGITSPSIDGLRPQEQIAVILARASSLMQEQQACWRQLREELKGQGIAMLAPEELGVAERQWLQTCFNEHIFPILTPIAVDPATAFPFIPNLGFCLFLQMERPNGERMYALIPIPKQVDRFIRLPGGRAIRFVSLEDTILLFLDHLFPSFKLVRAGNLRIIRDSVVEIDERAEDLVETFETALKARRRGSVIRLSVNADIDPDLRRIIVDELGVDQETIFLREGILGLVDIRQLIVADRPDLLFSPFEARFPERVRDFNGDIFVAIRAKDFIVHHPYESFDVVAQFVSQAAHDPAVIALKQTLYRTSSDSPIVAALIEAAEAGKQVTAVVELKARFDEEANIRWARELEEAGAHVVYGFVDKKIHAKLSLVVRREGGRLRSYAHFGTGNYHPVTARIYTDLSFFTDNEELCRDALHIFNYMTGYDLPLRLNRLAYSPMTLRPALVDLIRGEIEQAEAGRPAAIWIKVNALTDGDLIDELYRASQAGVEIRAIVRGICSLRPAVPGLSDNISVKSIVGRFLEHSRIFVFGAGNALPSVQAKVFISSADWMGRNMDGRVELLVPIENPTVHQQVLNEIMVHCLEDTLQSWELLPDGRYRRLETDGSGMSAHTYFMTNPSLSGRGSARERPCAERESS